MLAVRRSLDPSTYQRRAEQLRDQVLAVAGIRAGSRVTAYASTPEEPGTGPLLDALYELGATVLLPIPLDTGELDWTTPEPGSAWHEGRFGILEPSGPRLGSDAAASADVLLCPGVAGDSHGHRLGRGGGYYDRVLAGTNDRALRVLLLYDEDVLAEIPVAEHDQPVNVIVTPTRVIRTPPAST